LKAQLGKAPVLVLPLGLQLRVRVWVFNSKQRNERRARRKQHGTAEEQVRMRGREK
jgi:hypothetical protein